MDDTQKKGCTLSGAGLVFLSGLVITIIAGMALSSKNLPDADTMVNTNTDNDDGVPIDITKVCTGALIFGIFAMVAALIGCLGVHENNKMLLCGYIVASLFFAAFFLTVAIVTLMMFEAVEPTIERQVHEFCDKDNYAQLMTQMSCTAATADPPTVRRLNEPASDCDAACGSRVEMAQKMGGCDFMRHACNKKEYAWIGDGFCVLPDGTRPPSYVSAPLTPVNLESCQEYCDVDIDCTGIVHQYEDKECVVITKDGNMPAGNGWILQKPGGDATMPLKKGDATPGAICQAKDISTIVASLVKHVERTCIAVICIGSFLVISICCTCSHMYMVNTKRKGRKGLPALCASMFCPCCRESKKKNMLKNYEEDDEEGEASDGYE